MKKIEFFLLGLILITAFVVRLYRINNPIADWHAWRQADTSAVSRNFIEHGYDILHPHYYDISNVQSGFDNPHGYRFVEFPIYNIFQAGLYQLIPKISLEEWGRLLTDIVSVFSVLFIYLLGKRHGNSIIGFAAAAFFAIDPYSLYYGRTVLPDPSMAMTTLGGIYFFSLAIEKNFKFQTSLPVLDPKHRTEGAGKVSNFPYAVYYILATLFAATALLLKPFAIFFFLPMVYLAGKRFGWKMLGKWQLYVFAIVSVIPLGLWRWWIGHYPEGIPVSAWLFNGNHIRFTGSFFYWIFAERISKLILGYWGIVLVIIGFLNTRQKNFGFFLTFVISSLLYLFVVATGNVQHDYYQIPIISTIAFLFGLGVDLLIIPFKNYINRYVAYALVGICSIFMLMFGWYQVRDYFNINNPAIITAGQAVDRLTPKDAKVIAPLDGDTTFLYYTNRKGWPSFEHSLPELIRMGAGYLVLLHPQKQDIDLGKQYHIISLTPDYVLFDLHK